MIVLKLEVSSNSVIGQRAVAATLVDVVALLGRRADAATVTAEGGAAALGLALVVLEDEKAVITGLELGAGEGLIRRRVAPSRGIAGLQPDSVKSTHDLVGVAGTATIRQRICGETLCFLLFHVRERGLLLLLGIGMLLKALLEIHVLETTHPIPTGIATIPIIFLESLQVRHAERAHIHH